MPLAGTVQGAPAGAPGFDSDTVISAATAQQFYAQGYRFCVRYLSRSGAESSGDLSVQEATDILAGGLALMGVQHVRSVGWMPTADLGGQDGTAAASHAQAIGFPTNMNIWCDLEGVSTSATVADIIGYCNAWYAAVTLAGYLPGLYVGTSIELNGQQLYDLPFRSYWKSASNVPAVAVRGYQMVQTLEQNLVNGVGIDRDVTQTDSLGGQVQWLAPVGWQA